MAVNFGRALKIVEGKPAKGSAKLPNGKEIEYIVIPSETGGRPSIYVENPVIENGESVVLRAICGEENLKFEDLENICYNRPY